MKYFLSFCFVYLLFNTQLISQNYYPLPYDNKQWQYENNGENGLRDLDIDLPDAWKITTGGTTFNNIEIVIAIIDKGIDTSHEDLKRNIWINPSEIPGNNIDDDIMVL